MAVAKRVVRGVDFIGIAIWWGASFVAAGAIADDGAALWLRIGLGFALWLVALAVPAWIFTRMRHLDEMQQLILWRMLGGAGLFILSYLVAMAAYFTIVTDNSAAALMTMTAMAPPMAMMFGALLTVVAERAAEKADA